VSSADLYAFHLISAPAGIPVSESHPLERCCVFNAEAQRSAEDAEDNRPALDVLWLRPPVALCAFVRIRGPVSCLPFYYRFMPQTALITGASSGIGLELARIFARNHCDLILVARESDRLRQAAEDLQQLSGTQPRVIPRDLADPQSPHGIHAELAGVPVDYLVNNAGFGLGGPFSAMDRQTGLDMIQVNVTSLVDLTRLFLPAMLVRKSGRIMNVASTAAFQPGPLMAIYYATKAFVLSFTEAIAEELTGSGVTVTALCPGPTASDFQRRAAIEHVKLVKNKSLGMMSSRAVAEIGYRGMMQGKVIVIPGIMNKLGVQSLRLGPRAIVRKAARKLQES